MDVLILGLDRDPEQVTRNLGQLFGVDVEQARRIVLAVPYVAKREVPASEAHRYVRALTAAGCRAQARASEAGSARPGGRSLPAPRVTSLPEIEAAERAAIARWREAEGLGPIITGPPRSSRELAHSVPRAPRLPGELTFGPADDGHAPAPWLTDDPAEFGLGSSNPPDGGSFHPHLRTTLSARPGAVGLVRDSAPSRSRRPSHDPGPTRSRARRTAALGLLLAALLGLALFQRHRARQPGLETQWAAEGVVDASPSMPHAEWADDPDNRLAGRRAARAPALVDALHRSGVRNLWVVGYREDGEGRVAERLVVELPTHPGDRLTALWHIARFYGREATVATPGSLRYAEVDLR